MPVFSKNHYNNFGNQSFGSSFLEDVLSASLELNTSISGNYTIQTTEKGVTVIPHLPTSQVIDYDLYNRIYEVLSFASFPFYTVLKPEGLQVVQVSSKDVASCRGIFFPWIAGVPGRFELSQDNYRKLYLSPTVTTKENNHYLIPVMDGLSLDFANLTHMAIAGQSGSGKSYFLRYMLPFFARHGTITLVDPKSDDLVRWYGSSVAQSLLTNKDVCLLPDFKAPDSDFLTEVTKQLDQVVQELYYRQEQYRITGKRDYGHHFVIIDEMLAITQGVKKADVEKFFSNLKKIALLGRSAKIHLILVAQRFSAEAMPTVIRDQIQVAVQLGPVTKNSVSFLFPDYDPSGITLPRGKGTGIIQVQGDVIPYPRPFLAPTIDPRGSIYV